jgi:hypothetical protein
VAARTCATSPLDRSPALTSGWLGYYERFWTDHLDVLDRLLREEDARKIPRCEARKRQMSKSATPDAYGELIEPAALKIQRLLPGRIESASGCVLIALATSWSSNPRSPQGRPSPAMRTTSGAKTSVQLCRYGAHASH